MQAALWVAQLVSVKPDPVFKLQLVAEITSQAPVPPVAGFQIQFPSVALVHVPVVTYETQVACLV